MMLRTVLAPALLLITGLITGAALGQDAPGGSPPRRQPQFALPAGRHGVDELIGLLGQIRKTAICCERDELERATGPVMLQRELRLDGDAFDDVVTTLLFHRGLMVVPAKAPGGQQVIAMDERLRDTAIARTPAEILARPGRLEFVTTSVPPSGLPVMQRAMVLRPLFGMDRTPWAMRIGVDGQQVTLTGSSEQVAFALRVLQLVDGNTPTLQPAIAWSATSPLSWPGGKMTGVAFMKLFADTLDANVLGEAGAAELDLGAAAQLSAAEWFASATKALHSIGQVIVPAEAAHRVFLLRSKQDARFAEVTWRSTFETNEQVLQYTAVRPVLTVFSLQHVELTAAMNQLRPMLMGGGGLTVGSLGPSRLLLAGLRDNVAKVIEQLQGIDVAK
jgi:hypothetical protein